MTHAKTNTCCGELCRFTCVTNEATVGSHCVFDKFCGNVTKIEVILETDGYQEKLLKKLMDINI